MRRFILVVAFAAANVSAQDGQEAELQRLQRYVDGYITENHRLRAERDDAVRRAERAEAAIRSQAAPIYVPAPIPAPVAIQPPAPYIQPLQMNIPPSPRQLRCTSRNVLGTVYTDCN